MATENQVLEDLPTKIIVSGTNGEVLQEDPSDQNLISNPQKDGTTSPAGAEQNGPQNANQDEEIISKPDVTPLSIDEYLEKHKINVIFEELIFRTIDKTPENPLKFLHSNLEKMEEENWQPGESFLEKADAVKKIFKPQPKDPETDKPGIGKGRQGSAKGPKTGPIMGRNIGTKTVSTPAKPNPPRATGPTVKATPARITAPPKTGSGTRPATTPAKTTTKTTPPTAPPKTTTTPPKNGATAGAKTSSARTGPTGVAARTTSNTGASKQPVKPATTRPGATGGAAKTGSNTSLAKGPVKGPVKTAPAPARAGAKTTGAGARGPAAPKTTGRAASGSRPTGATKAGAVGATPRTTAGKTGPGGKKEIPAKDEIPETEPEPEPKVETPPAEEAKDPTPEPPQKPPGDDGMYSQIPGSDEATGPVPDSDEQLANQEIRYDSGDEAPTLPSNRHTDTHTSPLIDTGTDIPAEKPDTVRQEDRHVTSEDNARELQGIEDGAESDVRQRTEMNELADEGIDVDPDALFTPRMGTGNEKLYSIDEPSLLPPGIPAVPGSSSDSEAGKNGENIVELELGVSDAPLAQDSEQTTKPPHSPVVAEGHNAEETQLIGVGDVTTKSPSSPKPDSPELPPVQISIEKTFQNATHSPTNQSPTEPANQSPTEPANQSPTELDEKLIPSPSNQSPTELDEKLIPSPTNQSPTEPANQSPTEPDEKLISSPANQSPTEPAEKLISSPANQSPTDPAEKVISSPANQSPTEPAEKLIEVSFNQSSDPTADQANEPPQSTIDFFESQINTKSSPTSQPPTNPFETGPESNNQSASIDD